MEPISLYILSALIGCAVTACSLPLLRGTLGRYFLDKPGGLKRHHAPVPTLGGIAIMLGSSASLIFIRLTTNFPSGTLHNLRGILLGSAIILMLGILDDFRKPKGVSVSVKLAVQALAALCLVGYGVHITLFDLPQVSYPLTFLWVIGVTNAFNLLDISDGLCVGQATVCTLGLCLITLPSEFIYVNFCACALLGACLGFWPYNHARERKIFLGDSGSMLLGFIIAALTMGTGYSKHSNLGFLASLLILAVPLFDTAFVSLMRIVQGKNPLMGSDDHAALRLKKAGLASRTVLLIFTGTGILYNILAFMVTQTNAWQAAAIYGMAAVLLAVAGFYLARIEMR